jgi:hypothetical protein
LLFLKRSHLLTLTLLLLLPLLAHGLVGTTVRYFADDWCTAEKVRNEGFFGAQSYWYLNWSGRYAFTLSVSAVESLGAWMTPVLPATTLLLWWGVLTWSLRRCAALLNLQSPQLPTALLALLLLYSVILSLPDVHQSLYWQTGNLTYLLPLAIFTFGIGLLAKWFNTPQEIRPQHAVITFLIAWLVGGFSEMLVVVQMVSVLGVAGFMLRKDGGITSRAGWILFPALAGTLLALLMVVFAPGNAYRLELQPDPPGWIAIGTMSLRFAFNFAGKSILRAPAAAGAVLLLPGLVAFFTPVAIPEDSAGTTPSLGRDHPLRALISTALLTYALIVVSMAPSAYGISAYPPERALSIPQFILSAGMIIWGWFAGGALRLSRAGNLRAKVWFKRAMLAVLVALLLIASLPTTWRLINRYPILAAYAARWDARHQEMQAARAAGVRSITVPALGFTAGLADIDADHETWVNRCMAGYYGFEAVFGVE